MRYYRAVCTYRHRVRLRARHRQICANGNGPFDREIGFLTHSVCQTVCRRSHNVNFDRHGDSTCKQALRIKTSKLQMWHECSDRAIYSIQSHLAHFM